MAGTSMNPVQMNRSVNTSAYVSSFSISDTVNRLFAHIHDDSRIDNRNIEFLHLCTLLSRGIDNAVGKNETPDRASDLPRLMKEVFKWQNDASLLAAIMVLMISIKGACRNGWFNEKENEEIFHLWNEIAVSFCSVKDMDSEKSTFHQAISDVMLRFYPGMKMGETLVSVEATLGYGAFVKDFHISKTALSSGDRIYLVAVQTDNTETSSCIISPQQVNILLNGQPVDMRTCVYKDPGPQIPTNVTRMLKYGSNLLQVLGQFSGNYIIAVAFMSMVSNPTATAILDYVPPVAPASDLDTDLIEGTSRISLNCPISFKRIKTPVKGHLCKHFQCFDFDNYVDINSRRPSWRCPHCSQSVCFTDIRIDRDMVKVLKEVDANVSHVNISRDGLWETINDGDGHKDKQQDKPPLHHDPTNSINADANILDLTGTENDMDVTVSPQEHDKKPTPAQLQNMNMTNVTMVSANVTSQMGQSQLFSSTNMQLPVHAIGSSSNTRSNLTMMSPVTDAVLNTLTQSQGQSKSQSQTFVSNNMQLPVHAIGSSSNTRSGAATMSPVTDAVMNTLAQSQSQTSVSYNMQSQQHYSNSGYSVRYTTPARQITRTPIGVQALPDQTSARTVRYQIQPNQHQMMNMSSGQPSQNMGPQNYGHRDRSSQPVQQLGSYSGGPPPQQQSVHQFHPSDRFYSPQNQSFIQMIDSTLSSAQLPTKVHQTGLGNHQQAHHYNKASVTQRVTQNMSWTPPVSAPLYTPRSTMSTPLSQAQRGQAQGVLEGSTNAPGVGTNWRQTRRSSMRGSLSGEALEDPVYQQMLVLPTQPVQAAGPSDFNASRPFIPSNLQVLMENTRNGHVNRDGSSGRGC
ncbi:E4 SUMO-protein ligase PIAL2-like [Rutidosis leptorrhynchoides]|uniref:E4 SUMO-protein ligase PIAL2-like n=1 Tax=Rutidosis leptorrhynchoides TaxID=125765 RepID=UPI003A9A32AE